MASGPKNEPTHFLLTVNVNEEGILRYVNEQRKLLSLEELKEVSVMLGWVDKVPGGDYSINIKTDIPQVNTQITPKGIGRDFTSIFILFEFSNVAIIESLTAYRDKVAELFRSRGIQFTPIFLLSNTLRVLMVDYTTSAEAYRNLSILISKQ